MNPDHLLTDTLALLARVPWPTVLLFAVPLVLIGLVGFAFLAKRPDRRLTMLATAIGLTWSAQGMWDTAVRHYHVVPQLATVLFMLFELFFLGRMITANLYRDNPERRARPVRFVWTLAVVMGLVVALAEGIQQAPLRLAVPLLVAANWYLDLTSDDDPEKRQPTSWRWTPRRLGLLIGAIEPTKRDERTIDRDRHVARMRTLAFRIAYGTDLFNDLFRRRERLARLEIEADDEMLRQARAALTHRGAVLREQHEPAAAVTPPPMRTLRAPRAPKAGTVGVHTRDGRTMRRGELRADAIDMLLASVSEERPRGMTTAELRDLYQPPLGDRTAEGFAAEARKRINGRALTGQES